MKMIQLIQITQEIILMGYEKELPVSILREKIAPYCGLDKYKIKNTLETITECGYFMYVNPGKTILKINNNGWLK